MQANVTRSHPELEIRCAFRFRLELIAGQVALLITDYLNGITVLTRYHPSVEVRKVCLGKPEKGAAGNETPWRLRGLPSPQTISE